MPYDLMPILHARLAAPRLESPWPSVLPASRMRHGYADRIVSQPVAFWIGGAKVTRLRA